MTTKKVIIEVQDFVNMGNMKYQLQKEGIEVLSIKEKE